MRFDNYIGLSGLVAFLIIALNSFSSEAIDIAENKALNRGDADIERLVGSESEFEITNYCQKIEKELDQKFAKEKDVRENVTVKVQIASDGYILIRQFPKNVDRELKQYISDKLCKIKYFSPPPKSDLVLVIDFPSKKYLSQACLPSENLNFDSWMKNMQKQLKANWRPVKMNTSNKVKITYCVMRSGKIVNIKLAKSSGNEKVDKAAVDALKKANPLNHLPDGCPKTVGLAYTFEYEPPKKINSTN